MGVSFTPEVWEKLTDLRDRHQRLAEKADELRRLESQGEATLEDCERVEEEEARVYNAWKLARIGSLGDRAVNPDEEIEGVPRDA